MEGFLELIDKVVGKQLSKEIDKIEEDENLFDIGLNSIGFISIIIEIENQYGVFFEQDDLDLDKFNTLKVIKDELEKKAIY